MEENFIVKTWPKGQQINLSEHSAAYGGELFLAEMHVKEDGSLDDKPSIALVLKSSRGFVFTSQISAETFTKVVEAIRTFDPNYMK